MEIAYCGLHCDECPVYLASINKNTAEQIRLANEYSTDTCKFSKEDMYCLGCHSEMLSEKMCGNCEIRTCGVKKSFGNCAECDEFPCSTLENHLDDHSDHWNNLKQLAAKYSKAE